VPWIVCVGLCSLGLILLLIAAAIILSLIPLYLPRKTSKFYFYFILFYFQNKM